MKQFLKWKINRKKHRSLWLNYFRPNAFVEHISDINLQSLKNYGIKLIFCDLDNTLVPHFTKMPTKAAVNFVQTGRSLGMKIVVVSNNRQKRVMSFCNLLKPDETIYNAKKPLATHRLLKIIRKYNMSIEDVLFIGDQLITDILVANRIGCRSILTMPIVDLVKQKYGLFLGLLNRLVYQKLEHQNMLVRFESLEEEYEIL